MKETVCTISGIIGGAVATLFGGCDAALCTLVIFMTIDYFSGLVLAAVFKKSPKSEHGALSSHIGQKGLFRKAMMLFLVLIAYRLDVAMSVDYIKNAVVIGFTVNELISITENAGLMGIPLPKAVIKAVSVLKERSEADGN